MKIYWTKEKCQEEALKYETRNNFQIKSGSAYTKAFKNEWLDEICSHMKIIRKSNGYWTKEKCQEEALKYETRKIFHINSNSAYLISHKNEWLDEICSHMNEIIKPKNYWTKEKCQEEALKYKNKSDFLKNSIAYFISIKKGWLNDICSHMIITGNRYKRCIYAAEFDNNHVYIGLTYNINTRIENHKDKRKNTTVYKYIQKNNKLPIFKKISDYIEVNEASKLEGIILEEYKKNGWIILNKVKCGAVGGGIFYWTKEKCQEEALKYKTRKELHKKNSSVWVSSINNKWLDEICFHMINNGRLQVKNGFWQIKENCRVEALKYKTRSEFSRNGNGAYKSCIKNKWIDELCYHMLF